MSAWSEVIVSVGNLEQAQALWQGAFGFEPVDRCMTESQLQLLQAHSNIGRSTLLSPASSTAGAIRLVEFEHPALPVREGAENTDCCPKNLDVYVDDLPRRLDALRAAGYHFHSDRFSEVTAPSGVRFREIHMAGHDCINVVLLQLLDQPMPFTPEGFNGIAALVTTVEDSDSEQAFYESHLDLQLAAHHVLEGPEIEAMIGLPAGTALDIRILGDAQHNLGQIEIVSYGQASGRNLYPLAVPPARGILGVIFPDSGQPALTTTPAGMTLFGSGKSQPDA